MPSNTPALFNSFRGRLASIETTRKKAEVLLRANSLSRRDVERIYCGLFLESVTNFESYIERMFLGILTTRIQHPSAQVRAKVSFRSDRLCKDVVYGRKQRFVDWLPYERTEENAAIFLENGYPFTKVPGDKKQLIKKIGIIRNAIAHKSPHSHKQFIKQVLSGTSYTSVEEKPGGYLRSIYITVPSQTRFQEAIITLLISAKTIAGIR